MAQYQVVEKFVSINGEGASAGQIAVFVRFKGCNLNCSFCDTSWANEQNADFTLMSEKEIYTYIRQTGIRNVTLTGGEPLLCRKIKELLMLLAENEWLRVEIETNGSIDLAEFMEMENPPSFTMDYKLPGSGMEKRMKISNFALLSARDTVKFVAGSMEDLERAREIIDEYALTKRCRVYISPVFGKIEPLVIVDFLKDNRMNDVNIQLQMHKIIWDPDATGV